MLTPTHTHPHPHLHPHPPRRLTSRSSTEIVPAAVLACRILRRLSTSMIQRQWQIHTLADEGQTFKGPGNLSLTVVRRLLLIHSALGPPTQSCSCPTLPYPAHTVPIVHLQPAHSLYPPMIPLIEFPPTFTGYTDSYRSLPLSQTHTHRRTQCIQAQATSWTTPIASTTAIHMQ